MTRQSLDYLSRKKTLNKPTSFPIIFKVFCPILVTRISIEMVINIPRYIHEHVPPLCLANSKMPRSPIGHIPHISVLLRLPHSSAPGHLTMRSKKNAAPADFELANISTTARSVFSGFQHDRQIIYDLHLKRVTRLPVRLGTGWWFENMCDLIIKNNDKLACGNKRGRSGMEGLQSKNRHRQQCPNQKLYMRTMDTHNKFGQNYVLIGVARYWVSIESQNEFIQLRTAYYNWRISRHNFEGCQRCRLNSGGRVNIQVYAFD